MVDYLYNIFKKRGPIFDKNWFHHNEKNLLKATLFFYITSFITKFFLFSKFGQFLVFLFFSFTFFSSTLYFRALVGVFAYNSFYQGFSFMITNFPLSLLYLTLFVIFIGDLSLINTFLVCCPSVVASIKKSHGEYFIKAQFYNSTVMTLKASGQLTKNLPTGAIGGLVAGSVLNFYGEHKYQQNYETYVNAQTKNPDIHIKPPEKGIGFKFGFGK